MADEQKVRVDGRTIGYVTHSRTLDSWRWRDVTGNGSARVFEDEEEAWEHLLMSYEAAVTRFGRDAHASSGDLG